MGTRLLSLTAASMALTFAVACHRAPQVDNSRYASAIQRIASSTPAWIDRDKVGSSLWKVERDFYASRDNLPAWIDEDQPTTRLATLIDGLRASEDHGLDPALYGTEKFQQTLALAKQNKNRIDAAQVPELDARLTYAYLKYASGLLGWSVNPKSIYENWIAAPNDVDLKENLRKAVSSDNVRPVLGELAPPQPQYKG